MPSFLVEKYRLRPGLESSTHVHLPSPRALPTPPCGAHGHLRSCPALTRSGRAASAAAAPSAPVRSTWPVLLGTGCATVGGSEMAGCVNAGDAHEAAQRARAGLTFLPRIWLMAALSFSVHSATTLALISFIYNMKALRGFFTWGFFSSSFFTVTGDFLVSHKTVVSRGRCHPTRTPLPLTVTRSPLPLGTGMSC